MPVRGLPKVKCFVRLFVLAHNLLRMAALAPQLLRETRELRTKGAWVQFLPAAPNVKP